MTPLTLKRIILTIAAALSALVAIFVGDATDPVRPLLLALGLLLMLKLNLEYSLGLPMGITYPVAAPRERARRKRVLISSWFLSAFMVWGFYYW